MWIFLCCLRYDLQVKAFLCSLHAKGFCPLWVVWWSMRFDFLEKDFPHSHIHSFTLIWAFWCTLKVFWEDKVYWNIVPLQKLLFVSSFWDMVRAAWEFKWLVISKVLIPEWLLWCSLQCDFWLKVFSPVSVVWCWVKSCCKSLPSFARLFFKRLSSLHSYERKKNG